MRGRCPHNPYLIYRINTSALASQRYPIPQDGCWSRIIRLYKGSLPLSPCQLISIRPKTSFIRSYQTRTKIHHTAQLKSPWVAAVIQAVLPVLKTGALTSSRSSLQFSERTAALPTILIVIYALVTLGVVPAGQQYSPWNSYAGNVIRKKPCSLSSDVLCPRWASSARTPSVCITMNLAPICGQTEGTLTHLF